MANDKEANLQEAARRIQALDSQLDQGRIEIRQVQEDLHQANNSLRNLRNDHEVLSEKMLKADTMVKKQADTIRELKQNVHILNEELGIKGPVAKAAPKEREKLPLRGTPKSSSSADVDLAGAVGLKFLSENELGEKLKLYFRRAIEKVNKWNQNVFTNTVGAAKIDEDFAEVKKYWQFVRRGMVEDSKLRVSAVRVAQGAEKWLERLAEKGKGGEEGKAQGKSEREQRLMQKLLANAHGLTALIDDMSTDEETSTGNKRGQGFEGDAMGKRSRGT